VTLATTTPGAEIRYTPTARLHRLVDALCGAVLRRTSQTVKAWGLKAGSTPSAVASATFTITTKTALFVWTTW